MNLNNPINTISSDIRAAVADDGQAIFYIQVAGGAGILTVSILMLLANDQLLPVCYKIINRRQAGPAPIIQRYDWRRFLNGIPEGSRTQLGSLENLQTILYCQELQRHARK